MKMEHFFCFCGELTGNKITKAGAHPRAHYTQTWTYTNGKATFDGVHWVFKLNKE